MARRKLWISEDFGLPLDWIMLASVVYGARGSGKTTFGRKIAEVAYEAGQRFCVIDIKGDWYGLKSTADGKGEGIPAVVIGGDHADLPLEVGAGGFVAETIAGLDQSFIIDLEHFSKGKQIQFLTEFFTRLYDVNRETLLLLLDEAQRYAPQKPSSPQEYICLGAVEDIVKLGRKHGLGPVVFTQRGSGLNKEVSELCDMMVAFRTPGVLDQTRIKDWLGANATKEQAAEVMSVISGLDTGTAFFASNHPQLRLFQQVNVGEPWTFDSSATPKVGQRKVEPKRLAKADLEILKVKMADAIERAQEEDPKHLKATISALKRDNGKLAAHVTDLRTRVAELEANPPMVIEREEVPVEVIPEGLEEQVLESISKMRALAENLAGAADMVTAPLGALASQLNVIRLHKAHAPKPLKTQARTPQRTKQAPKPQTPRPAPAPERTPPRTRTRLPIDPDRQFDGRSMKLLKTLAAASSLYPNGLTFKQLAFLSKYSPTSSSIDAGLSPLRQAGMVSYGTPYKITDAGLDYIEGEYDPLPRGPELLAYWRGVKGIGAREKAFLDACIDYYPTILNKEMMSEITGYPTTSSSIDAGMSVLRKMGLVDGWKLNDDFWGAIQ